MQGKLGRTGAVAMLLTTAAMAGEQDREHGKGRHHEEINVQVGVRPYYLVDKLADGPLKARLKQCRNIEFHKTAFSIGHRGGATLQFPEHTREDHLAGARMGAGTQECDVTFTRDGELVCRHDECDLHTTTNILVTPLAGKCTQPFSPAEFDAAGNRTKAASALCCTSDLTVSEFKSLKGKMDASNPSATTPEQFQGGTPNWRTDLFSTGAEVLTHKESIELIRSLGNQFTPEAKVFNPAAKTKPEDVFGSNPRAKFTQKIIDEYKAAGVPAHEVWAQSFFREDVEYWIQHDPQFGKQAVYLDDRYDTGTPKLDPLNPSTWVPSFQELGSRGYRVIAPPIFVLLTTQNGKIVPSPYARAARAAGLEIITWTLERSGRIAEDVLVTKGTASPEFYYQSVMGAIEDDGAILTVLDVLAQ
ncbi:MAG TPA: glycerophosphodiester phosphodiesterase family protein, partial [Myxococcaceae bacterium]|nr:glycerophosphodiester phosphodiesterase family protein [Myxococcaceae bacterium]